MHVPATTCNDIGERRKDVCLPEDGSSDPIQRRTDGAGDPSCALVSNLVSSERLPITKRMSISDILLCLLAAICSLAIGCSDSDRASIQGTVTFDGQPIEKAVISFVPLPGTKSPTAGADVVDGKFVIPARGGTFAGRFRVTITASRPTGKKVKHPMWDEMVDEYEQYLPARYNTASELEVNVERGAANRFEFPLVSQ